MIGRTVGNYVVQRLIGQGGMGAVYLAEHPRIGKRVAIKVLHPEHSRDPQSVKRFFNEARAAHEIHNEHIVDILDFGELPDGTSYFAMEWLEGRSLEQALKEDGRIPLPRTRHIVSGVGRALAAAHARGIIHRDLKPDNIFLVARDGDPEFAKVLDFGIAKLTRTDDVAKTRSDAIIGTPRYLSPEQAKSAHKEVSHRTDIYSLGVIVYQMLTGRLPFEVEGLGGLLLAHMTQEPPPLRSIVSDIPISVEEAVLKALRKDPADRWESVAAFVRALGGEVTGAERAILSPEASTLETAASERVQTPSPSRRSRVPMAIAGAAVIALGAGGLVWWRMHANVEAIAPPAPTVATVAKAVAPPTVAPPETKVAPAVPEKIKLSVKATPADARVELDDAPLANPFSGEFLRDGAQHKLVVSARGYRTQSMWATFDQDRSLEVTLVKGREAEKPRAGAVVEKPVPVEKAGEKRDVYRGTKAKIDTTFEP